MGKWAALCAASIVGIGLAGCVYSVQQRASGWLLVETSHIQLRTNIDREVAIGLARQWQRSYDVLAGHALPCAPRGDEDRVQITVLPLWQFTELAGKGIGGVYVSAGVTWLADHDGQIVLPADLGPLSRQFFQHEMTHRLVESCFVRAPAWLHEGLAGFFETMAVESDRVTIGRSPFVIDARAGRRTPISIVLGGQRIGVLSLETLPSIEDVLALTSWPAHDWRVTQARYATAWALVHLLVLGAPDLAPRFERYLSGIKDIRVDPRGLFARLFEDVPLQDRLNQYLRGGNFDVLRSSQSFVASPGSDPAVRGLSEEEAHVHLAWLGARARDPDRRERVRLHAAAAKQSPRTRDAAHLVAAYALLSNDDLAGAEREVQDGLGAAPDNPSLLEARLDVLLARKAGAGELAAAAERLRAVARTSGAVCSLALAALRTGDRASAIELAARGLELDPRGIGCRNVGELAAVRSP
jgi:hypothetical protein